MRIVRRQHAKKSMKSRIKNLKVGMRVAFRAGRESVLRATQNMEYGEGSEGATAVTSPTGGELALAVASSAHT